MDCDLNIGMFELEGTLLLGENSLESEISISYDYHRESTMRRGCNLAGSV